MCCIWAGYKKCDIKNTPACTAFRQAGKGWQGSPDEYRGNLAFSARWLDLSGWGFRVGFYWSG